VSVVLVVVVVVTTIQMWMRQCWASWRRTFFAINLMYMHNVSVLE
jgi:hypothetical protein